jgi:hypothetical protein
VLVLLQVSDAVFWKAAAVVSSSIACLHSRLEHGLESVPMLACRSQQNGLGCE